MKLKLADDLSLPADEAVTESIAILAKRRAGKSTTARRLAEQLHKAKQQVVIVDPKGDWWGLLFGRDGKSPGLPFVVLGGEHGHIRPLEVGAGELVAKMVVTERVSLVLDLSEFRKHQVSSFMIAFMETLYRLKAKEEYRTPLMLIIDEADAIAPQKPQKLAGSKFGEGEERMVGAASDLVRRGGQRGIGVTMITQRSAVLSKDLLTQIGILIVLRTIAPQDIDAIDAWVDVHGTPEQRKELMASLPSLPTGTGWVWAPGWPDEQGIFKKSDFLLPDTFDSSATPGQQKKAEPKHAADVDLQAFKREMAATIEKAKAEDPKELKKRIAELERQVKASPPAEQVSTEIREVLTDADRVLLSKLVERIEEFRKMPLALDTNALFHRLSNTLKDWSEAFIRTETIRANQFELVWDAKGVQKVLDKLATINPQPTIHAVERSPKGIGPLVATQVRSNAPAGSSPALSATSAELENDGQQKILDVVAMLEVRGVPATRESVAEWIPPKGLHPNGGTYGQNIAFLRANGYLDGFTLTENGRRLARPIPTGLAAVMPPLVLDGQRAILDVLDAHRGTRYTRETLAQVLGLHPNGGTYGQNIARLRTMGLIPERGDIYLTEAADK